MKTLCRKTAEQLLGFSESPLKIRKLQKIDAGQDSQYCRNNKDVCMTEYGPMHLISITGEI